MIITSMKKIANNDRSIDILFDPQALAGKGWLSFLRLYSPTQPWFDKSWKPGEFEKT